MELTTKQFDGAVDHVQVVCQDCGSGFPAKSLIVVDALHVQCPLCLYVFFYQQSRRRVS
jgi:hypothetical protein